ncbi:hypothetical protein FE697_015355 [Mumia zhuanghuii]|uniref:Uncharacterized protein n=2 Tax=Mumia TaxID=1546255 RepID=A0ABW1QRR7_9ACTN|nr:MULTISPECIES: hypothetical protein [Mumia]KAA1422509.1 hypothetical protein FE697_015355 [Mumia zhuanghuii]
MNVDLAVAAIAGAAALLASLLREIGIGGPRRTIERDLAIAERMPTDSPIRAKLLESIEHRVDQIIPNADASRDVYGAWLAASLCGFFAAVAWRTATWGSWWWIAAAFAIALALTFVGLMIHSIRQVPRDAKGNPIEGAKAEASE